MAELSTRQVASFARSISSGRVFARFEFNKKDLDPLVEDLNYVTMPGVVGAAADIRGAGNKVLAYLKANFPDRGTSSLRVSRVLGRRKFGRTGFRPVKRRSLRLKEGWRVNFYATSPINTKGATRGTSLLGFYIDHRQANRDRIRTILASLESGSRPYTIRPKRKKSLFFPESYPDGMEGVSAMYAHIPARKGFGFLRKTEDYADSLLAAHGSLLENELQRVIEKGKRFKQIALGQGMKSEPTAAVSDALESIGEQAASTTLSKAKSPLKAIRTLKKRIKSRKFPPGFR